MARLGGVWIDDADRAGALPTLVLATVAESLVTAACSDPAFCAPAFKRLTSADGAEPLPTLVLCDVVALSSGPTGRTLLDLSRLGTYGRLATAQKFLDLGLLTNLLADIVQLGAANLSIADNFYLVDAR